MQEQYIPHGAEEGERLHEVREGKATEGTNEEHKNLSRQGTKKEFQIRVHFFVLHCQKGAREEGRRKKESLSP